MQRTWRPVVAGILNIIVGVFTLFGMFFFALILAGFGGGILGISRIADLMPVWLTGIIQFFIIIAIRLLHYL